MVPDENGVAEEKDVDEGKVSLVVADLIQAHRAVGRTWVALLVDCTGGRPCLSSPVVIVLSVLGMVVIGDVVVSGVLRIP